MEFILKVYDLLKKLEVCILVINLEFFGII